MVAPINPECAGEPMEKAAGPAAGCGVFASPLTSVMPSGDGSMTSPFSSLQAAVDQAAMLGEPVFACGKVFAENVHVPAGVTIYGALDCDNGWVWTGSQRTTIAPAAGNTTPGGSEVALTLDPGSGGGHRGRRRGGSRREGARDVVDCGAGQRGDSAAHAR